jgi:hypothetical protein
MCMKLFNKKVFHFSAPLRDCRQFLLLASVACKRTTIYYFLIVLRGAVINKTLGSTVDGRSGTLFGRVHFV